MGNAFFERCNSIAQLWAMWVGMSIVDAGIVFAVVALMWLCIRRKAPPQVSAPWRGADGLSPHLAGARPLR